MKYLPAQLKPSRKSVHQAFSHLHLHHLLQLNPTNPGSFKPFEVDRNKVPVQSTCHNGFFA
jgi:hypothetical protein